MLTGVHALMYSPRADQVREFLRDVVGFRFVDAGHGWLIFALPPAEVAVHPAEEGDGTKTELYLMCDDLPKTMAELAAKGVEFSSPVTEQPWGRLTAIRLPDGSDLGLYQPKHPLAIS
jgi:predicted enzyme related to lactoylglutathione lyase